jgi:ABC-type branched-subunit amino acid transport system substrate-binding protein/WD40 repeat protein/regulator of sirC expression with transglutaminase-like and TPR domain
VVAIGINDYKKPIASLDNAVNDANSIYDLFDEKCLRSGENIERYKLLNKEATLDGIRQQLETLKTKVKENDRLIFYYAGHGIALHSQESTESKPKKQNPAKGETKPKSKNKPLGYLIPSDAEMEGGKNYLSMEALLKWLGDIQCRHCLIILDCCYAGSVQWSLDKTREMLKEKIFPTVLDNYINKDAWFILTSSDENEKANDGMPVELHLEKELTKNTRSFSKTSGNSPFVECLKNALFDGEVDMWPTDKKDNIITIGELHTYLCHKVPNITCVINGEESRQTPQTFKVLGKHKGGEFVFLLNDFNAVKEQLPKDPDVTADDKHNPYRGLDSFTEEYKDCFFGRKTVTEQLFNHVCEHPLTVVVGASGAGKSSLVKAGLIPKFKEEFKRTVPSQSSNSDEETQRPDSEQNASQQLNIVAEMRPSQSPADNLNNKLEELNKLPAGTECLLLVDQFEEIETQCRNEEERKKFWNTLIEQLKSASKTLHIVLTLRADLEQTVRGKFESAIKEYNQPKTNNSQFNWFGSSAQANNPSKTKNADAEFQLDWVAGRFIVPAIEREELPEVIEKPAKEKAVFFTSDLDPKNRTRRTLVEQLVHEVAGMPGALPLLSFALYTMYRNFAQRYVKSNKTIKREITWEDYNSLGDNGVLGSLTKRATEKYEQLLTDSHKAMLRRVMLRMVTLDGSGIARRRVLMSELEYSNSENNNRRQEVIERFVEARLLVKGEDKVAKEKVEGGEATQEEKEYVEPAHDALILNWEQLREWIKEDKGNIILRDRVIPDVKEWQVLKDEEKEKLSKLKQPDRLSRQVWNALGDGINWAIKKCLVESELKRWNKQENVGQKQSIAASKNGHSSSGNTNMSAQKTADTASENLSFNQAITEKLSSHLPKNGHSFESNTTVTVQETVETASENLLSKEVKVEKVPSQAHSENTQHPKSSDRLWDKEFRLDMLGQQLGKLQASEESWLNKTEADFVRHSLIKREKRRARWITFLFFVGFVLLVATAWALNEQRKALIKQAQASRESAEANLLANRELAAATDILRAETTLTNPKNLWNPFFWVPQSDQQELKNRIKGTLYKVLYNTRERNELRIDRGNVYQVAFHPTENLLVTVGDGDVVRLWDTKRATQVVPHSTGQQQVFSVAFSHDGTQLATGGVNGKIKFWKLNPDNSIDSTEILSEIQASNKQKQTPETKAVDSVVRHVEFSGDSNAYGNRKLLSTIVNNQLKLWQFDENENKYTDQTSQFELLSQETVYWDAAFNPKKPQLATIADNSVKLWDLQLDKDKNLERSKPIEINTKQKRVYSVTFNAAGDRIATAGADKTVKWWKIDEKTNQLIEDSESRIPTESKNVYSIAVDTNNNLAWVGDDNIVRLSNSKGTIQPQLGNFFDGVARSVAISPDGKQLATVGGANIIRLWHTNGDPIRRFEPTDERIRNIAFSLDGKLLATVGNISRKEEPNKKEKKDILRLWDSKSGKKLDAISWKNAKTQIIGLVFVPETNFLAAIKDDKTVDVLFLNSWNKFQRDKNDIDKLQLSRLDNILEKFGISKDTKIKSLVFSKDKVAVITDKDKVILGSKNRQSCPLKETETEDVDSVAFSPDGQQLATAQYPSQVKLWNLPSILSCPQANQTKPLKPPTQISQPLSLDSKFDLSTQQISVKSLLFNPTNHNQLITGGEDGTVKLWDLSSNAPTPFPMLVGNQIKITPNAKRFTASSANGTRIATIDEQGLHLWDIKDNPPEPNNVSNTSWQQIQEQLMHKQVNVKLDAQSLAQNSPIVLSPSGKYLAFVANNQVLLWDIAENTPRLVGATEPSTIQTVAFSPTDAEHLITVQEDGLKRWSVEKGQLKGDEIKLMKPDPQDKSKQKQVTLKNVKSVSFSKINTLFNSKVRLATLEVEGDNPNTNNGIVRVWEASDDQMTKFNLLKQFKTDQPGPKLVILSPDGETVATGAANTGGAKSTVRVWDKRGNRLNHFITNFHDIEQVAFSHNSKFLAIVAKANKENKKDRESKASNFGLVDIQSGNQLHPMPQSEQVSAAMFTADDLHLATLAADQLSLWQTGDLPNLKEEVCHLVGSYLKNNPNVQPEDKTLCNDVPPKAEGISRGERLLALNRSNTAKLMRIEAVASGDFTKAREKLETSLNQQPNDPEARIYLSNIRIGGQKSYTIAVPVPISSNPDGAAEILRGVAQAQKELNESGGIKGTLLRVLIADDRGDPEVAEQVAQQIADNTDALGVVGHFTSDTTRKAGEIYKQKQLVAISPVSTAVDFAEPLGFNAPIFGNPYLFRTVPNDRQSAQALARYLWEQLKHEKAVVFFNSNSEYSKSLSSEFEKAFGKHGGQVVQKFDVSEPGFNPSQQVQEAINKGAQALVLLTDMSQLDATLEVVKANGSLSLLAGDDVYNLKTLQKGKDAVGMTVAVPWHIDNNPDFANAASSLWKATVNWRTAMAYDATQAFIEALRQNCNAQETKDARECIAQRLRSKDFSVGNGASGQVQFEQSGDRVQESQLVVVKSSSNSRSKTGYDFEVVLPPTDAEQNKVQPRPQNVPSPTPSSNNGQNNYRQAPSDRNQASKLNSVNAHINQGLANHRQGNYQQAISNYSRAIALNPNSAKAYSNRAAAYNEQKDYQKAIADSSKAISLNPTYANAYINRGIAYYRQGNSQQAIKDYNKAIELAPGNAIAYTNRALAYTRLGNQQAAQADRQKAAELSQQRSK